MDKLSLVAQFAAEIIKQQLASGLKHPSPPLIEEAVATAEAVVEQLDGVLVDGLEKRLGKEVAGRHAELMAAVKKSTGELEAKIGALVPPKAALPPPKVGEGAPPLAPVAGAPAAPIVPPAPAVPPKA